MFVLAGVCVGVALLVRPNLLPVGMVFGVGVLVAYGLMPALRFGIAVIPGGIAVLALNTSLYGSPFGSGYGAASGLFAIANMPLNLLAHGRALFDTQGAPHSETVRVLGQGIDAGIGKYHCSMSRHDLVEII